MGYPKPGYRGDGGTGGRVGDRTSDALQRIVRPRVVDIREVWPHEAYDFTPWLAQNIDLLSDVLGIQLRVEAVEQPVPDTWRNLDILASCADQFVAIKN
jgi:hypothetical protein